jgi:hypothetical protein
MKDNKPTSVVNMKYSSKTVLCSLPGPNAQS